MQEEDPNGSLRTGLPLWDVMHTCVSAGHEDVLEERDVVAWNIALRDQQRRHVFVLNVARQLIEKIRDSGRGTATIA
jgi:hypothetical protein